MASPSLTTPSRRRRADPKTQQIVATLRGRIVDGRWHPGVRLPTWADLEAEFGVGRTTLTRAMGTLKQDGFVFADATRGTFVAKRPPHLYRYAIAFRGSPDEPGWNRFWWSLNNHAVAVGHRGNLELECFYGVHGGDASPSHDRLLDQVDADRFAGVIFVGHPPEISKPLLEHRWLAKVAICSEEKPSALPHVFPDRESFVRRSLKYLRDHDRRRVAVITDGHRGFAAYDRAVPETGLDAGPCSRVAAHGQDPDSAARIVQLILNQRGVDRPDALIVTNDALLESAAAGVVAAGLRVPDDLLLLTHCNWPDPGRTGSSVVRLGFDARTVMDRALAEAESQRTGRPATPLTAISPVFDFELDADRPHARDVSHVSGGPAS